MANIPRAPFYVPRPSQEQLWSWLPRSTKALLLVPYEMGNEYFVYRDYDDFPSWSFKKNFNLTLNTVAPPSMLVFTDSLYMPRPGDDPYWSGNPLNATTIYMPTVTGSATPFVPTIWNFYKASSSA